MNQFIKFWLSNIEDNQNRISDKDKDKLLYKCGKACSDSYSLGVFRNVWDKTGNIRDFFFSLNTEISALTVSEVKPEEVYEIYYSECLCDLYTSGCMKTGILCECSRHSLLYNMKSIFPDRNVDVELIDSILKGGEKCILRITIK